MSRTVRILVYRPEQPVPSVEEIEDDVHAWQALVGGYFEHIASVRCPPLVLCIANEDGHALGLPINRRFVGCAMPLVGVVFFVGRHPNGESRSLTDAEVKAIREVHG